MQSASTSWLGSSKTTNDMRWQESISKQLTRKVHLNSSTLAHNGTPRASPLGCTGRLHSATSPGSWLSSGIRIESWLSSADPLGVEAAHLWCPVANHLVWLFLELWFYLVFAWSRTSQVLSVCAMIRDVMVAEKGGFWSHTVCESRAVQMNFSH